MIAPVIEVNEQANVHIQSPKIMSTRQRKDLQNGTKYAYLGPNDRNWKRNYN